MYNQNPVIKKCLNYSFFVLKWNLVISPVVTFFSIILSKSFLHKEITVSDIMYAFTVSFLTGGYLFAALLFELSRSREYYFYYNQGISRLRLSVITYTLNLITASLILVIVHYAKLPGG